MAVREYQVSFRRSASFASVDAYFGLDGMFTDDDGKLLPVLFVNVMEPVEDLYGEVIQRNVGPRQQDDLRGLFRCSEGIADGNVVDNPSCFESGGGRLPDVMDAARCMSVTTHSSTSVFQQRSLHNDRSRSWQSQFTMSGARI